MHKNLKALRFLLLGCLLAGACTRSADTFAHIDLSPAFSPARAADSSPLDLATAFKATPFFMGADGVGADGLASAGSSAEGSASAGSSVAGSSASRSGARSAARSTARSAAAGLSAESSSVPRLGTPARVWPHRKGFVIYDRVGLYAFDAHGNFVSAAPAPLPPLWDGAMDPKGSRLYVLSPGSLRVYTVEAGFALEREFPVSREVQSLAWVRNRLCLVQKPSVDAQPWFGVRDAEGELVETVAYPFDTEKMITLEPDVEASAALASGVEASGSLRSGVAASAALGPGFEPLESLQQVCNEASELFLQTPFTDTFYSWTPSAGLQPAGRIDLGPRTLPPALRSYNAQAQWEDPVLWTLAYAGSRYFLLRLIRPEATTGPESYVLYSRTKGRLVTRTPAHKLSYQGNPLTLVPASGEALWAWGAWEGRPALLRLDPR